MMSIRAISTNGAPTPGGHYSQAMVHNGLVYVAGQLGIDPATGKKVEGGLEAEAERALRNVEAILKASGSSINRVLKMTVYISDISLWGAFNTVYSRVLGDHRPARAVIPTGELHYGLKVEIECIAALDE
jgi:2-iminobutanoate/2-iminopropanoate deaminase